MPSAKRKLNAALQEHVRAELSLVFPQVDSVSAYDVLHGFPGEQQKKLVLAVETESRSGGPSGNAFEMHVVKLGPRAEVVPDVAGWQQCVQGRQTSRRMLVPLRLEELPGPNGRAAVIYQDAAHWYGLLTPDDEVATLAWAVERAVFSDEIGLASVERIVRQVFRELGRWFYSSATEDAPTARGFYRGKLNLDTDRPKVHRWRDDDELYHAARRRLATMRSAISGGRRIASVPRPL
jgi:hypothetical protein